MIPQPDVRNTDPAYWDAILSQHLLSEEQLELSPRTEETDEGEEEPREDEVDPFEEDAEEPVRVGVRRKSKGNPDLDYLRTKFDANDQFMRSGHQIKKVRQRERQTPEWAMDDAKVRVLVNFSFPKWRESKAQRIRAARWVRIIHLYYRMKMSRPSVAKEIKITERHLTSILCGIGRIMRGKRYDNRSSLDTIPFTPLV